MYESNGHVIHKKKSELILLKIYWWCYMGVVGWWVVRLLGYY
jgi:hypothetical protein